MKKVLMIYVANLAHHKHFFDVFQKNKEVMKLRKATSKVVQLFKNNKQVIKKLMKKRLKVNKNGADEGSRTLDHGI